MEPTRRKRLLQRLQDLKTERSSWDSHWKDLAEHIQPFRYRNAAGAQRKGEKRHGKIINSTATWALGVLSSGMMAGITSPARPWFRLVTPDPELDEARGVKQWLHDVEAALRLAYAKSNVYDALQLLYTDLPLMGTAVLHVDEDSRDGLRAYVFPAGEYCLANGRRMTVDTMMREVSFSVGQLVEEFGLEACSRPVRDDYEKGRCDREVKTLHCLEPNREADSERYAGRRAMPYSSVWMEVETGEDAGLLRESGYYEFPVMAPRWSTSSTDAYGYGPAMNALGDVRALQLLERRGAQLTDKFVNPPLRAPTSLMGQRVSLLPGDVTYVDMLQAGQTIAPVYEPNPAALQAVELKVREHEQRIKTAFYADLWLMMAQADARGADMTAREVVERHEEKMLQLGPVMERLQDELLDPLIERTFALLWRQGRIPPPPEELQGTELRVEYISVMAQAQKMMGTGAVERLAGFVGNIAAARPEVLDKLDFDQMVDEYAGMLGVPPAVIRPDDKVAALRAQRAAMQQQAMDEQRQLAAAQGAETLSRADMQGDNALNRMLSALGPAAGKR